MRALSAIYIRKKAEECIAQPFAAAEDQEKRSSLCEAEAAAALRDWNRKVAGNPDEQSPIAEHREGVHRCGENSAAQRLALKKRTQFCVLRLRRASLPEL